MKINLKLIVLTLFSVIMMGFALSLLNLVDLGNDPFTFMNLSISGRLGISFGNWQVFLNILMFIPVILFGRHQIGIGTVFNMVLVGYSVEFFSWVWQISGFDNLFGSMAVRLTVMIPALAIFILSAAFYMSADLGTAPYDALPLIISKNITSVPFKLIRFLWDCLAVLIGFLVSGKIGVVTILMVLFMGQTVTFVKEHMNIFKVQKENQKSL